MNTEEESAKEKRERMKLGESLHASLVEGMFINGDLSEKDFEDPKVLLQKSLKYLDDLKKKGKEIMLVVDHQPSLLSTAEKYIQSEDFELAYVFFATYFEHLINGVIQVRCTKDSISNVVYKELIRKVSLEDKFSWVLELLKLPKFKTQHWQTIKTVSDKRNSFIHYKYQAAQNQPDFEEREWEKLKPGLKSAITYSKKYQTKVIYQGKAKKLRLRKESD